MESGAGGGRPRSAEGAARRAAAPSEPAASAQLEGRRRRHRRPGWGRLPGGVLQRAAGRVPDGPGSGKAAASPRRQPLLPPAGRAGQGGPRGRAGAGRGVGGVGGAAVGGRGGAACGRAGVRGGQTASTSAP